MSHGRCRVLPGAAAAALAAGLAAVSVARPASIPLPQDRGAAGAWQALLKLGTTASAMHTTAHPDDEHGGVITRLGRKDGARVSLLTLTRGEAGDNAIGPELFDSLGLIRTEELRVSGRYYGLDAQYFTTAVDYGFSKRLDEALDKWGRDAVLRDVVRIVRMDRPFVLVSRFQGSPRDGHGQHQAAGVITAEAFEAAGDATRFPEQVAEGLRPWQPLKLYIGGVREDEAWNVRVDSGEYSPWLGVSYSNFARLGLSFQRSQNSGRLTLAAGPSYGFYRRVASRVATTDREASFFDGLDSSIPALFETLGRPAPAGIAVALAAIDSSVRDAVASFTLTDPSAVVPALAAGLRATREAIDRSAAEPDAVFVLRIKEQQFAVAINTALGIDFTAVAEPTNLPGSGASGFATSPTFAAVVPGQVFEIDASFTNRGQAAIELQGLAVEAGEGWSVTGQPWRSATLAYNARAHRRFTVTLTESVRLSSRPYFGRAAIRENRYTLHDPSRFGQPAAPPPATAVARYTVNGVPVEARETVRRREAQLPYGVALRELHVVPALSLRVAPASAIVPLEAARKLVGLTVDLLNNEPEGLEGRLAVRLPSGWTASPESQPFAFSRAGERAAFTFTVTPAVLERGTHEVRVVAVAGGREHGEGYDLITHRDLETRYLYRPAVTEVRGVDVAVVPNLHVGYVMGIGDQVPAGIAQLGCRVTPLDEQALATMDLAAFDAIMTGTRAYAVRQDLRTYNRRLLDYVRQGGNLIVLYNTQEYVPDRLAPYPGVLTQRAEEVSEEDSPVEILAPDHQVFTWPNRITTADFEGWVEQRGSKFWSEWDARYAPMLSTYDRGQAPQRGGWLWARYGRGHYTYFAYAFHRQLPYGVAGAYRLLANLLALGKTPPGGK